MSHSQKEEQIEQYQSIQDQVQILKKDLHSIEKAKSWDEVYEAILSIKKRVKYVEENYFE